MLGFWLQSLTTHAPFEQPMPVLQSPSDVHPRFVVVGVGSPPIGADRVLRDEPQQQAAIDKAIATVTI